MLKTESPQLLVLALEELGKQWEKHYTAEQIRLNIEQLNILLGVNRVVGGDKLEAEVISSNAPSFTRMYRAVMLRDVEELILNGNDA